MTHQQRASSFIFIQSEVQNRHKPSDDIPIRNSNLAMSNGLSDVGCECMHYHSAKRSLQEDTN